MELVEIKTLIEKPITGEWGKEGNNVKIIRTTNFTNEGKLNLTKVVTREVNEKKIETKQLLEGDIIIEKSGGSPKQPVGRVVFFEEKTKEIYLCNNFTSILRPKKEIVFPKYLHYLLFTNHKIGVTNKFQNKTTGIINLKLQNYINDIKIPLPSLSEQKRIAGILDEADKLRQLNQQLINKYNQLTQSLFLDMFGDPVTNPKGWEKVKFKDVLEIRNGKNQKKVLNPNGKYPIYGSGGIMNYADQYISDENSVIIGRKGNINKPILVKEKFWHVDTAFGLNPFKEFLGFNYLFYFCDRYNFEQHNKTVTIPSLTKATLLNIQIPIPPIKLQNEFAERINVIEQQKAQAQEALQKSEDLFNSLLQKAFKGEV